MPDITKMEIRDHKSAQFTHPSDFETTSIPGLSDLDNVLRCQVCKDYFETPTMTSCSHTFCSMCIRQAFSSSGQCPTCRKKDQTVHLRRNWPIQEAVTAWKKVRGDLLKAASPATDTKSNGTNGVAVNGITNTAEPHSATSAAKKRAIEAVDDANENPRYKTRSKKNHDYAPNQAHAAFEDLRIEEEDNEWDADCQDENRGLTPAQAKQAGKAALVSCPICGEEMLEAQVFGHLDHCNGVKTSNKTAGACSASTTNSASGSSTTHNLNTIADPGQRPKVELERITFLSYDLMKEAGLKKKLQQLGIRADGNKALMKARHMYWVDLWNANADSDTPRSRRELLDDLAVWERAIGRNQSGGSGSSNQGQSGAIMRKDFDRAGYQTQNTNQYNDLIAQARGSVKAKSATSAAGASPADPPALATIEQRNTSPSRTPSAPIPAESMFLGAAAQLNAAATARRGSNALMYLSPSHLQHSSSTDSGSGRAMPLYQMQEHMVTDMDEDIK